MLDFISILNANVTAIAVKVCPFVFQNRQLLVF